MQSEGSKDLVSFRRLNKLKNKSYGFTGPQSVIDSDLARNSKMARLMLALIVFLSTISATYSVFTCPKHLPCYCFANDENEYKIHCTTSSTSNSAFDITIRPDLVRVQCKNSPDWAYFMQNASIVVGAVEKFVFTSCAPPGPGYSSKVFQSQMNVQSVKYLKYEDLKAPLSPEDLDVFPELQFLVLSNNQLGEIRKDLLRGVPYLKQLELRNTNIQIPEGFFNGSNSLKTLELSGNTFKSLTPGIFDGLNQIELLSLWKNDFEELESGVFRNLQHLTVLDIHQNNLKTLPTNIFKDLKNLETINFNTNNFTSLPVNLFRNNSKLKIFKLLYNKVNLTTLPTKLLSNFLNLKVVSLMRSGIHYLPEDLFWGSTSMIELNLNRNYLTTLPVNLLKDAAELQMLSLSFNDLQNLDAGIFSNNKKLVKLDLSKNHLTQIGEYTFAGLESLQELNIENNELNFIHVDAFDSLEQLKIAKFSNNKLTLHTSFYDVFGQISPFHPCNSLEELHLAYNNITEIYSDWVIASTNLKKLDLSYNNFEYLQAEDFQFMSNKIQVDLSHNNIQQINLARLEYISINQSTSAYGFIVPRDSSILLSSNPIQCDCDVYDLVRYLNNEMDPRVQAFIKLDVEDLVCNGPEYMKGLSVAQLNSRTIKCRVESDETKTNNPCASDSLCECWMRPSDDALLLDCAGKNLTTAPEWIDTRGVDHVELDLSMNELTMGPNMNAKGYNKVVILNLAENKISDVEEGLITPNLKILNLDGNNLTFFNSNVLRRIMSNDSNISQVTLHNNPWQCDCSSRDLLSYVQSNFKEIPELLNITCKNSNISLSILSIDEICPFPHRLLIILCACIGSFGLLVGCVAALYFRFQREIKVWMYSKNLCTCLVTEDEVDRDKTYDAFISYSHKDEEFVVRELVSRLEEGPKPYKICIHIRDWLVGDWIPNQIVRSVEESRRTIVVLSPNFIESVWGRIEFQTAHKQALSEKRARVIVVVYGEIGPIDKLDPELRNYLQMNTYIKWGDPWFWQKLNYAMPHSVRIPKQIDQENNCLDSVNNTTIAQKQIDQLKVSFIDEVERSQNLLDTVLEISRSFSENNVNIGNSSA